MGILREYLARKGRRCGVIFPYYKDVYLLESQILLFKICNNSCLQK